MKFHFIKYKISKFFWILVLKKSKIKQEKSGGKLSDMDIARIRGPKRL